MYKHGNKNMYMYIHPKSQSLCSYLEGVKTATIPVWFSTALCKNKQYLIMYILAVILLISFFKFYFQWSKLK